MTASTAIPASCLDYRIAASCQIRTYMGELASAGFSGLRRRQGAAAPLDDIEDGGGIASVIFCLRNLPWRFRVWGWRGAGGGRRRDSVYQAITALAIARTRQARCRSRATVISRRTLRSWAASCLTVVGVVVRSASNSRGAAAEVVAADPAAGLAR